MAWLSGFAKRRALYANTSTIAADCTNIPLPVCLSGLVDLTGKVEADFDDAQFAGTDETTLLDYYWEVKTANAAVGHVEVPTLTAGQASLLVGYLYYGNASATDQSDAAGCYDTNYMAVWPLNDAGVDPLDVTGRGHNGTGVNTPTPGAVGQVGPGYDFELGSDEYFYAADHADFVLTAYTLEAWIKPESIGTQIMYLINQWGLTGAGNAAWAIYINSGYLVIGCHDGTNTTTLTDDTTLLAAGETYHVAGVYTGGTSGTNGLIYVNGTAVKTGTLNKIPQDSTNYNVRVAEIASGLANRNFDGIMDEVTISNTGRSASWIKARYMAGAGTLWTWGAEEAAVTGRTLFLGPTLWAGKRLFREADL